MGLASGSILQGSLWSSVFGQRIIVTRHYRFDGAGIPGQTIPEALDEVQKLLYNNGLNDVLDKYLACMPTNVNVDFSRVQVLRPTRSVLFDTLIAEPGTWGAACTTANLAGTVTSRTFFSGRNQVSVTHVGPVAPNAYATGLLTNDYRTALDDFGDAFDNPVDGALTIGGILWPCILHPDGTTNDLLSHVVGTTLRTMRRRNVGQGS